MAHDFTKSRRRIEEEREKEEEERAIRPKIAAVPAPTPATPEEEAKRIFAKVGDLSDVRLFGNRVMVAKFIRTTLGRGYLQAAPGTKTEDKWQGKIGLVIKKGTTAFVDDGDFTWHGDDVNVGDWVLFQYGDGTDIDLCPKGSTELIPCKVLKEGEIEGIVPRPDIFF